MAILCWIPALLYALLIFSLSAQSHPPGADLAPDYLLHGVEYGILSLTLVWGLTSGLKRPFSKKTGVLAWLLASAYGVTDEIHQLFVEGRNSSLQDLLADSVGALTFLLLSYLLLRLLKGNEP